MKIIKIKNSVLLQKEKTRIALKKNDLFVYSERQIMEFLKIFELNKLPTNIIELLEIEDIFFPISQNTKQLYIFRSGGIGDLIALSGISNYFNNITCTFVTQPQYKDIFKWFLYNVKFSDWRLPLLTFDIRKQLNKINSQINYEGKIESSNENWFNVFFKDISNDMIQYGRPQLKTFRIEKKPSNIQQKNNILLCLKASANIRSIALKDVLDSLNTNKTIYIHEDSLNMEDREFAKNKNIQIIKAFSLNDFLLDLYDAEEVISVDTGAVHFREGINKSCLGIYFSFSSECRTLYYKYVKTINIQSQCKYQPCFYHCFRKNDKCKFQIENKIDSNIAPCADSKYNKELINQLTSFFNKNLS